MGRIHPVAEGIYFNKYSAERNIVRPFLSCFDVSSAYRKKQGQAEVAAYYLKPEPFIAELIGLDRELLLVYAPFADFQARTLILHDEILLSDRTRLDPLGSIIISDDPDTASVVQDFLAREPERPPIVALSNAQVSELTDANSIRALFVEQFFRRDLFALESPLATDTFFFGRQETVTQLLDRFRSGQNSGLFGLRRIGKTSVLFALARRCEAGKVGGSVYLDLSSPALYGARWWDLLQAVARSFAEPLELERSDRSKLRALTITYNEKDAAGHFKADIERLTQHYGGHRLLLLLDEIENITFDISPAEHWQSDFLPFWQTLRSVHQDMKAAFCFVVAGVNPHIFEADRVGKYDNPLFSTSASHFLGPFNTATVRDMVRKLARYMGLKCEEGLYRVFLKNTVGMRFLFASPAAT